MANTARPVLAIAALLAVAGGLAVAQTSRQQPPDTVKFIELPIKFPVVGNVDAVKRWRLGRLQDVRDTAGTDIVLEIRLADGSTVQVVGPGPALAELAFRSDWVRTPSKQFPGARDYVERLVAFDYDADNRVIAMASLEPMNRDPNRLWRVLT